MVVTPTAGTRPASTRPSRLGTIKKGVIHEPYRFFLYGPEGVGKSSLANDAPAAIFLDTDRASSRLHVARYPFRDGEDGYIALTLAEIYAAIDDLLANPHSYRTLVIDTIDRLEQLLWDHVCERQGPNRAGDRPRTIEEIPYGNGYKMAVDEWRVLCHRLDQLRLRRGMDIVLLGHSVVKKYANPLGEDFDRFRPRLDDRALAFLKEWVDVVGFVAFEDAASKLRPTDDRDRPRGIFTGRRLIHLEHSAAWDAKTRLPMPAEVELSLERPWSPFAAAVDTAQQLTPDNLRSLIEIQLAQLGDAFVKGTGEPATADAVRGATERAGDDLASLGRIHNALKLARRTEVSA